MKRTFYAFAIAVLLSPGALAAQSTTGQPADAAATASRSLRDQLMPSGAAAAVTAPVTAEQMDVAEAQPNQPVIAQRGGSGVGYMIAGAALFVAGLLIESDAGTFVAVAGAAIGAYGLYLHFR